MGIRPLLLSSYPDQIHPAHFTTSFCTLGFQDIPSQG